MTCFCFTFGHVDCKVIWWKWLVNWLPETTCFLKCLEYLDRLKLGVSPGDTSEVFGQWKLRQLAWRWALRISRQAEVGSESWRHKWGVWTSENSDNLSGDKQREVGKWLDSQAEVGSRSWRHKRGVWTSEDSDNLPGDAWVCRMLVEIDLFEKFETTVPCLEPRNLGIKELRNSFA